MRILALSLICLGCLLADSSLAETRVFGSVEQPLKDISSQPAGFGLGLNGDLAHENHTRARYFFSEHPEDTAKCFQEAGVRLVRAYPVVPFWQGDRAIRRRFYERWSHASCGKAALDMSKPWHWTEPKDVYDFYRKNDIKILVCLSSLVYDAERDAMSSDVELVRKTTLDYLDWLQRNGYANQVVGFELDNEPYYEIRDPKTYAQIWKSLLPEIAKRWPGTDIGLPVAIYVKGDPDLDELKRRFAQNDLLQGPRSDERVNQWSGNAVEELGDSVQYVTHLVIHVYGAGYHWNCNYAGVNRTNQLRKAYPRLSKTRTWITEWRDQSDNDPVSQRRFRTMLWKANYILMSLSRPEVDAVYQHSIYGLSGVVYWSTGSEWYYQRESAASEKLVPDTSGIGHPHIVSGACGALYRMLFGAMAERTALLGFGASRGLNADAAYYASIVRHDRAKAKDAGLEIPFDGDCMWTLAANATGTEGSLVAVNTHADPEKLTVEVKGRRLGPAVCQQLVCPEKDQDRLETPGQPLWHVETRCQAPLADGRMTIDVPPFSVLTARFSLERNTP